ncbi:Alpha/Beta hydrolase protein [Phycomyces nitens]|nr:Alpha/Beta hydrolase protein [Phycomyces nitens]
MQISRIGARRLLPAQKPNLFQYQRYLATQKTSPDIKWSKIMPRPSVWRATIFDHFTKGPPAKSWTLPYHLLVSTIHDIVNRAHVLTVEQIQYLTTRRREPIPSGFKANIVSVPASYREQAGEKLSQILSLRDQRKIGWDWQSDRKDAPLLEGEWMEKDGPENEDGPVLYYLHGGAYYLCSFGMYRPLIPQIIKESNARSFSIDYRLAPQHPFPTAVEDALAGYLYLINPPPDAGFSPVDPKKIVVAGDSAGGGLTLALLMAIRDAGLPPPAGGMPLSPWVDLTHSLPSILANERTDFLPRLGFKHTDSPALDYSILPKLKYNEDDHEEVSIGPFGKTIDLSNVSEEDMERVQFYTANESIKLPLVSPVFDKKSLHNLPKLLIQVGDSERLRDEGIYAALKASGRYPGAPDSKTLPKTPVILEIYQDQPHVFQILLPTKATKRANGRLAKFLAEETQVDQADKKSKDESFVALCISPEGEHKDVTQEIIERMTLGEWNEWEARLARPSLTERLKEIRNNLT